ncbi:MAG: hypothetical protein ACKVTZ_03685 [Bacteroidia bacterium]
MAKELKITKSKTKVELTREQKKFNTALKKISKFKQEIEQLKEDNRWLLAMGDHILQPALQSNNEAHRDLVLKLYHSPFKANLTKKQKEKFGQIILSELEDLVAQTEDPELIAIYNEYNEMTFEEEMEEAEAQQKQMMEMMMKQMFGVKVDLADVNLDDPEEMEKLQEEVKEKAEKAHEEREAKRKKTPKQLAQEAKAQEMEAQLAKTSKKLYLELVKHFHPDQEQDEVEKERKTAIMQEITVAYKNDDFLKLLELQVALLEEKEDKVSSMNDATLVYYNKILKEQVDELEMQVRQLRPNFNGHPYGQHYRTGNRTLTEAILKKEAKEFEEETSSVIYSISLLETAQEFKKFVKDFKFHNHDMINFADLFTFIGR